MTERKNTIIFFIKSEIAESGESGDDYTYYRIPIYLTDDEYQSDMVERFEAEIDKQFFKESYNLKKNFRDMYGKMTKKEMVEMMNESDADADEILKNLIAKGVIKKEIK